MPSTSETMGRAWRGLRHALRRWRRTLKAHLPYVRRREYAKLARKYGALADAVGMGSRRAVDARIVIRKPVTGPLRAEVCLFVSHHCGPALKPHVQRHMEHLLGHGIDVVLVLNADDPQAPLALDDALAARLRGVFVRENIGYDFAGWAHAYALVEPWLDVSRLYLVNDSVIGPLDAPCFSALISRVRASPADMLGLTEALQPQPHLQSFFLVFHGPALDELARFFDGVLCFADKATVIDVYEMRLTQRMRAAGYRCEALFPALSQDPYSANDTWFRWAELLDRGFPYVKASVLRKFGAHPRLRGFRPLS